MSTGGVKGQANEVEIYLKKEKTSFLEYIKQPKLLILGSSDSGKSTLLKQMKIMHGNGFTEEEVKKASLCIKYNILTAIYDLLLVLERCEKKYQDFIAFYSAWPEKTVIIPDDIANQVKQIWNEPEIQSCFQEKRSEIYLDNSHVPTNNDILMVRSVTQHVCETVFTIKNRTIRFYDVSGLVHHRKFWLSYFDHVHTVLFVMSLASYDQYLMEDPTINRMVDALVLFEQMVNHKLLQKQNFVLFMNKKDIYETKIKKVLISSYFPEYSDKPYSVSKGVAFFKKKFMSQVKVEKSVVSHVTCATDTMSMKVVLDAMM
ncbi:hypothetical protein HDV06_006270 [Boothiomyces sp. JEL0866]|nr:hypothetical protein HDV06_006270 [Boothiomyces sp. JEL0866]